MTVVVAANNDGGGFHIHIDIWLEQSTVLILMHLFSAKNENYVISMCGVAFSLLPRRLSVRSGFVN